MMAKNGGRRGTRSSARNRDRAELALSQETIAARAYEIYLARGAGGGRDLDDWLEAERELKSTGEGGIPEHGRSMAGAAALPA